MSTETNAEIKNGISQLHTLLDTYHALFDQVKTREPTDVELLALAGILHSFYSGFENIFKRLAQDLDGGFRKTDSWHADLLESMAVRMAKRPAVVSQTLKERLQFYLSFRHFFRSAYSYDLNWSKMQDLVFGSEALLMQIEKELYEFINNSG